MAHDQQGLQEQLQRIEALIARVEAMRDPALRAEVGEVIQAVLAFHGAGLERLLELAWEAGPAGEELIQRRFAADRLVGALLLLHGLHPLDLETRVRQALDAARPELRAQDGDVELLAVDGGVVRLRLHGSCQGFSAAAGALRRHVEEQIYEHAPDLVALDILDGAPRGVGVIALEMTR